MSEPTLVVKKENVDQKCGLVPQKSQDPTHPIKLPVLAYTWRWRQEGYPQAYSELGATLGYMRYCHKTKPAKKKANISIIWVRPFPVSIPTDMPSADLYNCVHTASLILAFT